MSLLSVTLNRRYRALRAYVSALEVYDLYLPLRRFSLKGRGVHQELLLIKARAIVNHDRIIDGHPRGGGL